MKKIFCLILYCFSCYIVIQAQSDCGQDSIKYLIAYDYIVNDFVTKGEIVMVSDSIIDLDRYWFSEELKNFPEEQRKMNQYRVNKGFVWSDPFYSSCITSMFPIKEILPNRILFFSQIEDNILLADLLPLNRYNPYIKQSDRFNYAKMTFQNMGRIYLFIFCGDGNLKATFSREIIYD